MHEADRYRNEFRAELLDFPDLEYEIQGPSNSGSDSCLDVYLDEMKHYPRISPNRELVLGKRVSKGVEVMVALLMDSTVRLKAMVDLKARIVLWLDKKIRPNPGLGEIIEEMKDGVAEMYGRCPKNKQLEILNRRFNRIEKKVREGMNELVTANLRLVIKVAKSYMNRGLSFEDLIQEGNMGLIKAAGKYDFQTGYRFSTYASWWIRQAITRAIYDKARTIRLPVHLLETRNAYFKTYFRLTRELGREPDNEEVAAAIGASTEAIDELIIMIKDPIWLDTPKEEEEGTLSESLICDDEASPLEKVTYRQLCRKVREVLAELPRREEKVIRKRFGIEKDERVTLDQLGKELKISRERVRQLETQALNRLRSHENLTHLASLV